MPRFNSSDEVPIAYRAWGAQNGGIPVLLHHGFGASSQSNWVATGIVDALAGAGRRVLALDARGHGESGKPWLRSCYGERRMARDVSELLDHLGAPAVDLVGYSMGAVVALILASTDRRVRRLVAGGVGEAVIACGGMDTRIVSGNALVQAMLASGIEGVAHPGAVAFRQYADRTGADRQALAAHAAALNDTPIALADIRAPTLVLAGDADPLALRPGTLADAIPGARLQLLSGDHLGVFGQPAMAAAIVEFLGA